MIEAKNLTKVYKPKKGVPVYALNGVSLKLPETGMVFILGKSGSGKSTLLNVLGGLDSIDSGEIIIKGTSAKSFKQSHYDSYRNTYIGFIFQEYNILDELTVGANVALAIELQGRRATDEEINSILAEVDLEGYGYRKPNELSGGQKQRVAIARALVKHPEIIMADEPTGALDSETGRQVFDTLKKLSRDKLVLIVSHDREFSEQYADRIIELADGKIISDVEKITTTPCDDISTSTDENLTFSEGQITVKAGYSLTEEDRILINRFLSDTSDDLVIKKGKATKTKVGSSDFVPTREDRIKNDKKGDFKLIKSKLSIKNAFKLGSGALKYKRARLVFTIILSLVAFTLFGLADTIAAYDNISTATNSIYDTGVTYASYVKLIKWKNGDREYWNDSNTYFTQSDIELIKEQTGCNVVGVYKNTYQISYQENIGTNNTEENIIPEMIFSPNFSGMVAITDELIKDNGFEFIAGGMPAESANEIVITKYAYEYFKAVGHVEFDGINNVTSVIEEPEDLIGKTLSLTNFKYQSSSQFKIVGIVDTNFDYTRYIPLADKDSVNELNVLELMTLSSELDAAQDYSFATVGFVNPQMINDLIKEVDGQIENINNSGNFVVYLLNDASLEGDEELFSNENILTYSSFYRLCSLDNIKDDVVWLDGVSRDKLEKNEVVLSVSLLRGYAEKLSVEPNLDDPSMLTDFEKQLYDASQLYGDISFSEQISLRCVLRNPRYFAALRYATEHETEAKEAIKKISGWSDSALENQLLTPWHTAAMFASYVRPVRDAKYEPSVFRTLLTDEFVTEYTDGVASRYNIASYTVPREIMSTVVATYTHNGIEWYSSDPYRIYTYSSLKETVYEILGAKYAADNFDAAKAYIVQKYGFDDDQLAQYLGAEIVGEFGNYVRDNDGIDSDEHYWKFQNYSVTPLAAIYSNIINESDDFAIYVSSSLNGATDVVRNVKVVGVIPSEREVSNSIAVVNDGIIDAILGANRGGIYSYVVGNMPTARDGVNKIVKFSEKYINDRGDVRFELVNNVTMQLDMAEGLLETLGQVFVYVGIGFAVFAALMLTNFINTSISYKKQDIGILRAIGSRSNDVFRIFFAESFIIAMIIYVLTIGATFGLTEVLNGVIRNDAGLLITFINFGIRQIALLFGVTMLVVVLATFFPVRKIAAMKPIDAIKNRK